jgi:DNA polymerase
VRAVPLRQIDVIKPKVIVALGKFAGAVPAQEPPSRSRAFRGREYRYRDAILIPTYHPAYLLRNPSSKREVWEDMKRVRELLGGDRRAGSSDPAAR